MSLMQCKNSTIQNAINNTFFVMLNSRLYKPVSDWLELLPLDSTGLNM